MYCDIIVLQKEIVMIVKKSNEVRAAIQKLVDEHAIDTAVQLSIIL